MNNSTGIVPTMPIGGYDHDGFGGGSEWIFGLVFLAAMMNGGFGWGNNGYGNNLATQDQVAIQSLQDNLFSTNTNMNNGFNNVNSNLFNGFDRVSDNVCDVRQAVYNTGAGLSNQVLDSKYALGTQILENKYASQLGDTNTQRDVLTQTAQLGSQAAINALENQAHMDSCCCDIKSAIAADGEKTRALITDNLINDLRTQLVDEKNKNSDLASVSAVVNAVRPYPTPAYLTASPYSSLYNGYAYGLGNGFFGNNII